MDGLLPKRSGFGFGQGLKKSYTNHLLSTIGTLSVTTVFMRELAGITRLQLGSELAE